MTGLCREMRMDKQARDLREKKPPMIREQLQSLCDNKKLAEQRMKPIIFEFSFPNCRSV